jgi:hypothetical protein
MIHLFLEDLYSQLPCVLLYAQKFRLNVGTPVILSLSFERRPV